MIKSAKKSARRLSRELAVKGLYQWQMTGYSTTQILSDIPQTQHDDFLNCDAVLFDRLLRETIAAAPTLQTAIEGSADRPFGEIDPIEKAVLLLAVYEFAHDLKVPYRVIINEAVELAKTFGGPDGHKYVNGILNKLAREMRSAEIPGGDAACN